MGHGTYLVLSYGCILPREFCRDGDKREELEEFAGNIPDHRVWVDFSYEAQPESLAVDLAISNEAISRRNEAMMNVLDCAQLLDRAICLSGWKRDSFCVEIDELPPRIVALVGKRAEKAKSDWEAFRTAAAAKGFNLPEGKFLVISDYD